MANLKCLSGKYTVPQISLEERFEILVRRYNNFDFAQMNKDNIKAIEEIKKEIEFLQNEFPDLPKVELKIFNI